MLGARERDLGREEVPPSNFLEPEKAGLSVGGCVRTNYFNILPQRLAKIYPQWARGAKGKDAHKVWAMGEGTYESAPVNVDLKLRIPPISKDNPGHGLVAPNRRMLLEEYQAALAATQDQWKVDEEHSDGCPVCKQFGIS